MIETDASLSGWGHYETRTRGGAGLAHKLP